MKRIVLIFLMLVVFGCKDKNAVFQNRAETGVVPLNDLVLENSAENSIPSVAHKNEEYLPDKASKLIKDGSMSFEVKDLYQAKETINHTIKASGSYFEHENYSAAGNRISYLLKIRTPAVAFESMVRNLEKLEGKLLNKNISVKDVTEDYTDLNLRLKNSLEYLEQYNAILKKAGTITELLEVQEKIRNLEEEIESKKGRIKFIDDKVAYSTLNIEIIQMQSPPLSVSHDFWRRLVNAFKGGFTGLAEFMVTLTYFWPLWLVAMVFILFRKSILNRFKKDNNV